MAKHAALDGLGVAKRPRAARESTVDILEMAAIGLTTVNKDSFTRDELKAKAHCYAGPELAIRDGDLDIVIGTAGFLKKRGAGSGPGDVLTPRGARRLPPPRG
jgi:hypothetical protein